MDVINLSQPALPSLDKVKLVEQFIRDHSGEYKKRAIWNHLRNSMPYRIYNLIFSYFENNLYIARDRYGTVGWISNPDFDTSRLVTP